MIERVREVYQAIGVPDQQADRLRATQYGILNQVGMSIFMRSELKARLAELIREAGGQVETRAGAFGVGERLTPPAALRRRV
ncbi:hypothetical protein D3C78_1627000 [compost metagenome]